MPMIMCSLVDLNENPIIRSNKCYKMDYMHQFLRMQGEECHVEQGRNGSKCLSVQKKKLHVRMLLWIKKLDDLSVYHFAMAVAANTRQIVPSDGSAGSKERGPDDRLMA